MSSRMFLESRSPHLFGALRRRFKSEEVVLLDRCFELAMAHGGEAELDYTRPVGMSFNPRPARVALILLEANPEVTVTELGAAILVASGTQGTNLSIETLCTGNKARYFVELPKLIDSAKRFLELPPTDLQGEDQRAFEITLALLLDRARHLHLASHPHGDRLRREFLERLPRYLNHAQSVSPRLYTLLAAWISRTERSFSQHREERSVSNHKPR